METKLNELIAGLFSNSMNIEILCSIYDGEITAEAISNILGLDAEEVTKRLNVLCTQSIVKCRQKENKITYSLANPKVCDSILMLKDSIGQRREFI